MPSWKPRVEAFEAGARGGGHLWFVYKHAAAEITKRQKESRAKYREMKSFLEKILLNLPPLPPRKKANHATLLDFRTLN